MELTPRQRTALEIALVVIVLAALALVFFELLDMPLDDAVEMFGQ
jgi:hypothetical protein